MAVVLVLSLAATAPAQRGSAARELAACDKATFAAPLAKRDYRCYMPIAQRGGYDRVIRHVSTLMGRHSDDPGLALVRARMYSAVGKEAAVADFRVGIAGLAKLGRVDPAVKGYVDLARFYFRKNRHADGRQALDDATKLARAAKSSVLVAIVDISRAMHRLQTSDIESARTLAASALAELPPEQKVARSIALYALTRAAYRSDRLREALVYAGRLSALLRERGAQYSLAASDELRISVSFELRAALYEPDLRTKYVRALEQLVAQAAAAGNVGLVADMLRELYLVVPDGRAEDVRKRAVAAATRIGDPSTLLRIRWIAVDRTVLGGGFDVKAVLAELDRIAADARKLEDSWIVLDSLFTRALALWEVGRHDDGWAAFQRAFTAIEAERDAEPSPRTARGAFARRLGQYNAAAGRLLRVPGWQAKAMAVIERARGRQLLAMRRAAGGGAAAAMAPPTVPQIQALLHADEAVVSYFIGPGGDGYRSSLWWGSSGVFVITKRGFRAFPLAAESTLSPAVDTFLGTVMSRRGADTVTGPALYRLLLRDAVGALPAGVRRMVIVGDGAVHRLPFGALRAGRAESPLAARYAISYAPSIALWHQLRSQDHGRPMPRSLLALANPTVSGALARPVAAGFRASEVAPLPGAEAEGAFAVARIGGRSELRTALAASEQFVKSSHAATFSMFHIAAHAVLNARWPDRSALLLAAGAGEDGRVDLGELSRLNLRGRVIVLAACESADGNVVGGEGPISLARAGFVGGARALIASLWPLRDDEALLLFREFYRHVDRGLAIGEALATAKRARMRAGAPTAAWAGVVLMGDAAPHLEARARPRLAWVSSPIGGAILAGLAVACLGLAVSFARRRRRAARA